jgi:hypothetical protein
MKITLEQALGILRHTMTVIGTILVMVGSQVDDGQWQMLSGAILGLGATIWSIFSKPSAQL